VTLRELIPHAAGLALNLSLFGAAAVLALLIALRALRGATPRARYLLAVASFLFASAVPLAITFRATRPEASLALPAIDVSPDASSVIARGSSVQASIDDAVSWSDRAALSQLAVALWLAGVLLLLVREAAGYMLVGFRRRHWTIAPPAVRELLRWPEEVPLWVAATDGPAAVGFLRPAVVLPASLIGEAAEAVARHELAHARWRDPLVNSIVRLARALLWPSLPLWVLERIIRLERESAADAAALERIEAGERAAAVAAYAATLIAVAGNPNRLRQVAALGNGIGLEVRIRRLFADSRPGAARVALASVSLSAAFLCIAALPAAAPSRPPIPHFRADGGVAYQASAAALTAILSGTAHRNHTATPHMLRQLDVIRASGSVEPLREALADSDRRTREAAAWVAGELGDARLTAAVAERLRDEDAYVQHAAAWALGTIGDTRAIGDLRHALHDRSADARAGAAWALGRRHIVDATEELIAQLHDRDADAQQAAAWALGRLGDARAAAALRETVCRTWSTDVREEARRSLRALHAEEAACSGS
jgi:beta-lactamase regulating signal transducer with metallopeptidase domain